MEGARCQNPQALWHEYELRLQPLSSNTITCPDPPLRRQPVGNQLSRQAGPRADRALGHWWSWV